MFCHAFTIALTTDKKIDFFIVYESKSPLSHLDPLVLRNIIALVNCMTSINN